MSGSTKARKAKSKNKGFENISRDLLQTPTLSLKARGLISLLVSLPDEWDCNGVDGLVAKFCDKDGSHAVNEGIKELEAQGLFVRMKRQGAGGKWEWLWTYSQDPAEVAAEVFEWEARGYKNATRGGPRNAKPPKRTSVSGKSQHGSMLGESVDGGSAHGSSVHGEPPNKEVHSPVPTEQEVEVDSEIAPLRSGARTPAAATVEALFAPAPADEGEEVATKAAIVKAERKGRRAARTPAALNATAHSPVARKLVDAYGETCNVAPVGRLYVQFCVEVTKLLQANYPEDVIAQALVECGAKGYSAPALASFAHGVANRAPAGGRVAKNDARFQRQVEKHNQMFDEHGNFRSDRALAASAPQPYALTSASPHGANR